MIAAIILGCVLTIISARVAWLFGELQLKSDNAHTRSNLAQVYRRLEQYHKEHGAFPAQQDMKSLLKTLGMSKNDFEKVLFFDIKSAEYHAPADGENDFYDHPFDPLITIRVRNHVFGENGLAVLRRDGIIGYMKTEAEIAIAGPPPVDSSSNQ